MRIQPIINTNYRSNTGQPPARTNKSDPNFNALLHVSWDVEELMRLQAFQAAKGNTDKYKELMYGFGKVMVDLHEKIKPLPGEATVVLNKNLVEFMSEPPESRGVYYGPQLSIIRGIPIPGTTVPCYEFTYKPSDTGLVDKLFEACKNLLK